MINKAERKAIRERAESATPGPWVRVSQDDRIGGLDIWVDTMADVADGDNCLFEVQYTSNRDADAEFVIRARTDVPALLDALEAAEVRCAKAYEYIDALVQAYDAARAALGETKE